MANDLAKRAAARAAVDLVETGMIVGLGSGTTASFFIEALAARVRTEGLQILGVPTSRAAGDLARREGLETEPLTGGTMPDLTVDGADEFDPGLNLIKGGGGALVQEKIVAASSGRFFVIADASKQVDCLGRFPLPVAVMPFGWETTRARLVDTFQVTGGLRQQADGEPYVTDDGLYLIDLHFERIPDPERLEGALRVVPGVADVGLFVGLATGVIVGGEDGTVRQWLSPA